MEKFLVFLSILLINIKIMLASSSHYYNIPTFIQQNDISVPAITGGFDSCRFFQIKNSTLYRMGQSNIISSWNLNSFAYTQQDLYQTLDWSVNISNIAISQKRDQIAVTLLSVAPSKKFDVLNSYTLQNQKNFQNNSGSSQYTIIKVQSTQNQYLQLVYSNSSLNYLNVYNKNMTFISQINLNFTGLMNSTMSEDESAIVIWNYQGIVRYVEKDGSSWIYRAYYTPYSNIKAMNNVAISKNGSIAILQYDSLSPFVVIDFEEIQVISQKNFSHTVINQAMFLDYNCHLIAIIVNYTTLKIYDTQTLTLKSSTIFSSISNYSAIDYSLGKLYFCLQQDIKSYKIQCPALTYRKLTTNQCKNCTLSNNCNGCDQDTGFCNSCKSNFTLNPFSFQCQKQEDNTTNFTNSTNSTNTTDMVNSTVQANITVNITKQTSIKTLSYAESQIANATLQSFNAVSPAITTIFTIIQMSPFALIFLSFMNYWNLCCLYSILEVKVPEYLPQIHQKIFQSIQTSILQNIGFNLKLPILDDQRVSPSYYRINYNISLDFINSNFQNAIMIFFVLVLMLITISFRNFFLRKSSLSYNLLKFSVVQSLIGQFISFVPFCILTYKFLMNTGMPNFQQKLNIILQVFLLILCFLAPCIFIWSRSQTYIENKVKKSKSFKEISRNSLKSKILIQKAKSIDKKTQNQNFKELQMLMINISVPFLIILPVYFPFFIVNLSIFLFGVRKASKSTKYRINSIISACYLPLYHSCYIIFYLFGQNEYICHYVGLFCLVVLFLGGIHQLCNVVLISLIELFKWMIKTIRQNRRSSKISNQPQKSQPLQNQQISISENIQQSTPKSVLQQNYKKNMNLSKNQVSQQYILKNKIKSIKFKIQRTYKGLQIGTTNKSAYNIQQENIKQIKSISQKQQTKLFSHKIMDMQNKNIQTQQKFQKFNSIDKNLLKNNYPQNHIINQILNKDYIQRSMKSTKVLPKYEVL